MAAQSQLKIRRIVCSQVVMLQIRSTSFAKLVVIAGSASIGHIPNFSSMAVVSSKAIRFRRTAIHKAFDTSALERRADRRFRACREGTPSKKWIRRRNTRQARPKHQLQKRTSVLAAFVNQVLEF